mmetsp:Transcript_11904/g.26713  ORF Transcript_11904/g.26713 Transcript_11904/m.26713 type:complete len:258 (+) Transcript_11904:54-827(+)
MSSVIPKTRKKNKKPKMSVASTQRLHPSPYTKGVTPVPVRCCLYGGGSTGKKDHKIPLPLIFQRRRSRRIPTCSTRSTRFCMAATYGRVLLPYGFYSLVKRSFLGRAPDDLKLEFCDTRIGKAVNAFTVWEKKVIGEYKVEVCNTRASDEDIQRADGEARKLVREYKVVVFSFLSCPFCVKAKSLLRERYGVDDVKVVELDDEDDESGSVRGPALQAALGNWTGRTSMPNIFVDGVNVGGCYDGTPGLVPMIEQGLL